MGIFGYEYVGLSSNDWATTAAWAQAIMSGAAIFWAARHASKQAALAEKARLDWQAEHEALVTAAIKPVLKALVHFGNEAASCAANENNATLFLKNLFDNGRLEIDIQTLAAFGTNSLSNLEIMDAARKGQWLAAAMISVFGPLRKSGYWSSPEAITKFVNIKKLADEIAELIK